MLGEGGEREAAGERERRTGGLEDVVVDGVVGDVLADALLAGAAQADDGALALELAGDRGLQGLERVVLDLHRQLGEQLPGAHRRPPADLRSVGGPRGCSCRGFPFQAADQLVEAQLLQRVADGAQLARAQLDQRLALPDQLERLVQAGLAGVQAADDLLDARRGGLVGLRLGCGFRSVIGEGSSRGPCRRRTAVPPRPPRGPAPR